MVHDEAFPYLPTITVKTMLDRLRVKGSRSVFTAVRPSSVAARNTSEPSISPVRASIPTLNLRSAPFVSPSSQSRSSTSHNRIPGRTQRRLLHFNHDFANRPGPSDLRRRKASPLDEITRLRELINRANATNSKLSKERILAEFDDLRPLLAFLYDPYCRLHVTSSSVHNYLAQRRKDEDWQSNQAPLMSVPSNRSRDKTRAAALRAKQEEDVRDNTPASLRELFHLLASRQITGNEAMAMVRNFLNLHGIIGQHEYALSGFDDPHLSTSELFRRGLLRPTSLEIFYRCLDRNLKAGFGERILRQAFVTDGSPSHIQSSKDHKQAQKQDDPSDAPVPFRGSFEVALGRTVTREELPSLFSSSGAPKWYASRKLDGVRCLFVIRLQQEHVDHGPAEWKVTSIQALSRNGRPFSTLAVLEGEIARTLSSWPELSDLLCLNQSSGSNSSAETDGSSSSATLILDGEVCILRPPERASASAMKQFDGTVPPAESNEGSTEHNMVEDFAAVVGLIKRNNFTIPEPAFFPFDLLTLDEFTQWRSEGKSKRTFSQRLGALESLVSFFETYAQQQKIPSLVRRLSQQLVNRTDEVEKMLETASQRGWEGIVLRQDTSYEGKRSRAIRKFKEWKDAEYTVQGITVATLRLPIDGRFEEREAMASIQIEHKGTRVSVGSGFTPEQRVEFAKDPEKIVGKVVTVQYFNESRTIAPASARVGASDGSTGEVQSGESGDQNEVFSLRFPRIKQIWGQERDV